MKERNNNLSVRIAGVSVVLSLVLAAAMIAGISVGSSGLGFVDAVNVLFGNSDGQENVAAIIREIRLPRVILAASVGATLSLGGLVFQALLRNALAEPYILGISGGSAVGAIIGLLAGYSSFPGIGVSAFLGSLVVLFSLLGMMSNRTVLSRESLLLGGVMLNAFCSALIMFLISLSTKTQAYQILFWLMGDLSMFSLSRWSVLAVLVPCAAAIFFMARGLNLLLLGEEGAATMGIDPRVIRVSAMVITTLMVSLVVSQSGLIGFVGLVVPHVFRLLLGADHRVLVPACILGGGSYLVICDMLARIIPAQGEMPVGIVTAMIGAPLFVVLLWRAKR